MEVNCGGGFAGKVSAAFSNPVAWAVVVVVHWYVVRLALEGRPTSHGPRSWAGLMRNNSRPPGTPLWVVGNRGNPKYTPETVRN